MNEWMNTCIYYEIPVQLKKNLCIVTKIKLISVCVYKRNMQKRNVGKEMQ